MHKFPLISSCTSNCAGKIGAGSKLQVVCKEIHCREVSFSTFPVVVRRVPGFQRLNNFLYYIICKTASREQQGKYISFLWALLHAPSPKEVSPQAHCFGTQPFASAPFFKLQRSLFIMPIHTIIYIYTYVCALLAAHTQAHLPGWRSAHREVGRSISLKRNCQAVMGFGGQPRALLSPGTKASQRHSSLCGTPREHDHWHTCQSKEDFKEESKEESWLVLQTVIQPYFVEVIIVDNAAVAEHRPTII